MVIKHLIILSYVTSSENQLFFLGMGLCLVSENAKQESKINSAHGCPSNLIFMCLDKDSHRPASEHKGFICFSQGTLYLHSFCILFKDF